MGRKIPADVLRHLSFALVGGFFGAYAILGPGGIFGNAQTVNLLQVLFDSLFGQWYSLLLHLISFACYVGGCMLPVILRNRFHANPAHISPLITAAAAVILGLLPQGVTPIVTLYPIFFAMSFQWTSFSGADGFNSATIFSTNNTKQASIGFAEFLCDGDRSHLHRTAFYGATLICFHLGAAAAVFAVKLLDTGAVWCVLPLVALSYASVLYEERSAAAQEEDTALPMQECSAANL